MSRKMKGLRRLGKGLLWLSITAMILTGCGSKSIERFEGYESQSAYDAGDTEEGAYEEDTYSYEAKSTNDALEQEESTGQGVQIDTSSDYNRKVIKTGCMTIQTKTFSKTVEDIVAALKLANGYVESMDMSGVPYYENNGELQQANLRVRIPQQAFDSFMNNGSAFGNVMNLSCSTEDITSQYVDTERHVAVLETRYDRLLELMKEVKEYDDIFKFEKEIAEVEYEINSYKGTLNQYDSLVDMATIDIRVEEVKEYVEVPKEVTTFGDKVKIGLADSWKSVASFFERLTIGVICFLPYLLILAPIGFILLVIIKKTIGKNQKKEEAHKTIEKENAEEEDNN